jgi:hypothetical protein
MNNVERVRMPKSEAEHDNTKRIITQKKTSNSNLFIYILIVAEVERFRSTAGSLLAL